MTTPRLKSPKIVDIECLRGIAILFTVMAHLRFLYEQQPNWLVGLLARLEFWGGVDLFFVISGFVICKNIIPRWRNLSADAEGRLRFVFDFWLRRTRRLLPASWFWALASFSVICITQQAPLTISAYEVIAALLQVYNLHAYACAMGRTAGVHAVVGVYWSLSLEEQIYILLPVAMILWKRTLTTLFVGMLMLSLALEAVAPHFSGFVRFDGFCWGMIVALLYDRPRAHALVDDVFLRPLGRLKYAIGALALAAIPAIGIGGVVPQMRFPLTAICAAALVLLASYDRNYLGVPRMFFGTLVYLGSRSYSIYLIHRPVLNALRWLSGGRGDAHDITNLFLWPVLMIAVTVGLSELSFRLIEERWRCRREGEDARHPVELVASAG